MINTSQYVNRPKQTMTAVIYYLHFISLDFD